MRDPDKLQEIEALGQEDDEEQDELYDYERYRENNSPGWGGVPLLQAAACALAVLVLLFFKLTDEQRYTEITEWYSQEMAQEIELPQFGPPAASSSPSPEPTPKPSPEPSQLDSAPQQMI